MPLPLIKSEGKGQYLSYGHQNVRLTMEYIPQKIIHCGDADLQ